MPKTKTTLISHYKIHHNMIIQRYSIKCTFVVQYGDHYFEVNGHKSFLLGILRMIEDFLNKK